MSQVSVYDARVIQQIANDWKLTPATFAHKISRGTWIPAAHLQYISLRIAKAVQFGNGRIIISAPPRHGKSQLTSIYTPAWLLERFPTYKTILAGYGAELATGFSRQVRDIFVDSDNKQLLRTRIRKDSSRVEAFLTEQGGGMYAVGLGGAITGRGANVLLIDDYIKEIKEALSPTYRDYIWNWFVTTAFTRLEPGGTCIIIATRWHSDDLIGRILQNYRDQWEYIELPAIAEEGDMLGREIGVPLFPQRYPLDKLEELRETLGSIFFQALYQQRPVDESQKITDGAWLKVIPMIPEQELKNMKTARVWDLAATPDGGDYCAGAKVSYNPKTRNTFIENIKRGQWSASKVEQVVRDTALDDGEDCKIYIEQEPGSSGIALIDHYARNVLTEFSVEGVPVVTKKIVRAQPFLATAESGKAFLVEAPWNQAFIKEFDAFPSGPNDDQVDTVSAGFQKLSGRRVFSAAWGRTTAGHSNTKAIRQAMVKGATRTRPTYVRGAVFGRG